MQYKKCFVLQFHHFQDKNKDINGIINYRFSVIDKELQKCFLYCSNCHAEHHARYSRNSKLKEKLLEKKGIDYCQQCNYRGINFNSLDFHHCRGEKIFNISKYVCGPLSRGKQKITMDTLLKELDKCDVICKNCHAIKHIDIEKYKKLELLINQKVKNYQKKPKPVNINKVFSLKDQNLNQAEIARIIGCSRSTICKIFKDSL